MKRRAASGSRPRPGSAHDRRRGPTPIAAASSSSASSRGVSQPAAVQRDHGGVERVADRASGHSRRTAAVATRRPERGAAQPRDVDERRPRTRGRGLDARERSRRSATSQPSTRPFVAFDVAHEGAAGRGRGTLAAAARRHVDARTRRPGTERTRRRARRMREVSPTGAAADGVGRTSHAGRRSVQRRRHGSDRAAPAAGRADGVRDRTRRQASRRRLEPAALLVVLQRGGELVQLAREQLVEVVGGELDPVVGDPPLREVVGADLLRALAGADLRRARRRPARPAARRAWPRRGARAAPSSRARGSAAATSRPASRRRCRSACA